jgi:hypothetical protein
MALDSFTEFSDDDPYRKKVYDGLGQYGPDTGIVGPMDGAFPSTNTAPQPSGSYDLEAFRKSWMGGGDVNNPQGWLDANRNITQGVTLRNEKAYDPSGKFIADLVGNYSGGTQPRSRIFLDGIGSNGLPRTAKTAAKGAKGTAAGTARAPMSTFQSDMRKLLLERMNQLKGVATIEDPILSAQSGAYRRGTQRSMADERAMLAERAAANGTLQGGQSSGGFDTSLQGIAERGGEANAAYDANLVGDENDYRRATYNELLREAMASGDAESARDLTKLLADMDAQLRREGMAQSASQFNAGMDFDRYRYDDTAGFNQSRAAEDDYRWRALLGLGG